MSTSERYTQAKLRKKLYMDKQQIQIAWIPQHLAKIGKTLTISDDDGWEVVETYSTIDCNTANMKSRDWTKQRKASDI
jgi:predicted NAD-dependent protein-ADP-ribosyltransferase YbiA (DUF1768 family)